MSMIEEALRREDQSSQTSTTSMEKVGKSPQPPALNRSPSAPLTASMVTLIMVLLISGAFMVGAAGWLKRAMTPTHPPTLSKPIPPTPRSSSQDLMVPSMDQVKIIPPTGQPLFVLNGVVEGSGEPYAVINGMVVTVGEEVSQATVTGIRGGRVTLRCEDGRESVLSVPR